MAGHQNRTRWRADLVGRPATIPVAVSVTVAQAAYVTSYPVLQEHYLVTGWVDLVHALGNFVGVFVIGVVLGHYVGGLFTAYAAGAVGLAPFFLIMDYGLPGVPGLFDGIDPWPFPGILALIIGVVAFVLLTVGYLLGIGTSTVRDGL